MSTWTGEEEFAIRCSEKLFTVVEIFSFVRSVLTGGSGLKAFFVCCMRNTCIMQRHVVNSYETIIVLNHVTIQCGTVIQSNILEIHNFVDNNYQYDIMELLEKHRALT